ncbi:MAG: sigma-70 family RNA polymerase sigma factor [Planctomycetes bacterium]|nr:sigma-70 family RNA polymerase sigma factor [Planctomycetota bacterium]
MSDDVTPDPTEPAPALPELLERRRPELLAFIERRLGPTLRGKVEPQDIAQEVAIRALRASPPDGDPFGWLCHLAERCIIDGARHFSAGKRAADRERAGHAPDGAGADLVALIAASVTSPSQAAVRSERQRRLDAALAALPDEHREVLRLRYGEGLATAEIAVRLNKSDVAVRVLLTRVVQRLQELLGSGEMA